MGDVVLKTVPNVELVKTGTYHASTGTITFTRQMLADCVVAYSDPGVRPARLKIGHTDPRFNDADFDGEPALGTVINLRITDDGNTLVGDLTAVPEWLADGMESLYPSRSIEADLSVHTSTDRSYSMVLTALALLGTTLPAVQTLQDIQTRITGPLEPAQEETIMAKTVTVQASLSIDEVVDAYYDTLPQGSWAWVREVRTNPDSLIVDPCDDGPLWLVAYTVDANDNVTFADPQSVRIQYVAADDSERVAASAQTPPVKVYASRPDDRAATISEENTVPTLRERLGLVETATQDEVDAAALAALDAKDTPPAGDPAPTPTEPTAPAAPAVDDPAPTADPAPIEPATAPADPEAPETVKVDAKAFKELQARAAQADALEENRRLQDVEKILASAITEDRKFGPASAHLWRLQLQNPATFVAAKAEIDAMPKGVVPLGERGTSIAASHATSDLQALMDRHFQIAGAQA